MKRGCTRTSDQEIHSNKANDAATVKRKEDVEGHREERKRKREEASASSAAERDEKVGTPTTTETTINVRREARSVYEDDERFRLRHIH